MSLNPIRTVKNFFRDIQIGGKFLGGGIESRYGDIGAFKTSNSQYEMMDIIFSGIDVSPKDVLVDVGCGKGRVLNYWLTKFPRNRIYGIELDPDIANNTARRLRKYDRCSIITGDAVENLPEDGTIFYLFNPFDEYVMSRFKEAIEKICRKNGNIRIIYLNCVYKDKFENSKLWNVSDLSEGKKIYDTAYIRYVK